ncbi:putative CP2 transcription factor [Talaromyces proteolyticus]|uniref:CP2 transcription factor n=1 Tax=Talaromyces proteolyticus TaxID=1131652 RepID=A0AAD4PX31_9EURO|nr:putative CP2 transcription factor [Talaromyces proteolyticus]KAH8692671.1 putative CP2 transcription factor [Talaromyces proteolyticus]
MFRNRRTSQKPGEEFINKFRKSFPDVISSISFPGDDRQGSSVNQATLDSEIHDRPENDEINKPNDPTPRALQDIRFTPSVLDPNSFQFMDFANQPPGYYTPNTGGMTTIYHPQAGDLHTPLPYNLGTPISIPNTISASQPVDPPGDMNVNNFTPNMQHFMPQPFQNMNPFAEQTAFAPNSFIHRDSTYDPMDRSEESSMDQMTMQGGQPLNMMMPNVGFSEQMDVRSDAQTEKFRYGVTLRAPTAMIKHHDEIPMTYLNKGQAYSISVVDTAPRPPSSQPCKYRTFIRVSFEDEQQRSKPATCWQLWKEGRGSSEAYQRGGKLLAVEYVDPMQGGDEDQRYRQVELQNASFDGFCVTWTANPTAGSADCAISVRFNFLSTDFSHSKGVKGIPVRLCAKTEILTPNDAAPSLPAAEVCYCKVKLFRDHGAERKLSNDIAHVKKNMDKLKQQIAQMEMGGGNFNKRKRSSVSIATKVSDHRPVKIPKHKRTWSMDSQENGGKLSPEDDLHLRYSMLQDMFSSTRPISVLNLRGDEQDDPDLFPVALPSQKFDHLSRQSTLESLRSVDGGSGASVILSPTNSSISLNSPRRPPELQLPNNASNRNDDGIDWSNANLQSSTLNQPTKVRKNTTTGYIEAIDIDPTYNPPAERPPKPIACFYIRFPSEQGDDYYRAVYLNERTVHNLMNKISEKYKIDEDRIVRLLRINHNGLRIMMDDDIVQQLPEGQDMVAEFSDASNFQIATPDVDSPTSAVEVSLKY